MEFKDLLKKKRNELKLTQQGLADELYVSRRTVSRWENGLSFPDVLTVKRMSALFNINIEEMYGMLFYENKKITNTTYIKYYVMSYCLGLIALILFGLTRMLMSLHYPSWPYSILRAKLYYFTGFFSIVVILVALLVHIIGAIKYYYQLKIDERNANYTKHIIVNVIIYFLLIVALVLVCLRFS